MLKFSTSVLCLLTGTALFGQAGAVDVFPDRSVSADKTQINVSIDNPSDEDLFCEVVQNFAVYRSSATINNIEQNIPLQNVWIPGNLTRTFTLGAEKTAAIRESGLFPDAYIDVVENNFLSSLTKCSYKPMDQDQKLIILRNEAKFSTLVNRLNAKGAITLSDGERYPFVSTVSSLDKTIIVRVEDAKPKFKVNPTWTFVLSEDGSFEETYEPFVDYSGVTEAAYSNSYSATSSTGKARLGWLKDRLSLTGTYSPQQTNKNLREMLIGILNRLGGEIAAQPVNKKLVVFDGENVPFFASQNWDTTNSKVSANQGGRIATVRLNVDSGWAAAGIPLNKFSYVDLSAFKKLQFKARGSRPFTVRLYIVDSNEGNETNSVSLQVDAEFKSYSINMNALSSSDFSYKNSQILIFATTEAVSGTYLLDIDDVVFTE